MQPLIDADVLEYRNGGLYWIKPQRGRTVGRRVGSVNNLGYRQLTYKGVIYLEHRIIWSMFNGPIPKGLEIDHIDRNPGNNELNNLRLVTRSHNQMNKGKGWVFNKETGKYRARYHPTRNGKQTTVTIGYFDTPEEASKATMDYKWRKEFATCSL